MAARPLVTVSPPGALRGAAARIEAAPAAIERARRRALEQLRPWAERRILEAVAEAVGVDEQTWTALGRFSSRVSDAEASLTFWIGTNPIALHHLGTVTWNRREPGARVGSRLFPGTWAWNPAPVLRRTGTGRGAPVEVATLAIHGAVLARIDRLVPELAGRFEALLRIELRAELKVAV